MTSEREREIRATVDERMSSRMREAAVLPHQPVSTYTERQTQVLADALLERSRNYEEQMRESSLLDLSEDGIPTIRPDGAPVLPAAEPGDPTSAELAQGLFDDGIPLKGYGFMQAGAGVAPSAGPTLSPMRSSAGDAAITSGLRELEARARHREQLMREVEASPFPVTVVDGDLEGAAREAAAWSEAERTAAAATSADGLFDLSGHGIPMRESAPAEDPDDLIDLSGPGVPAAGPAQ